jgi:hypothetical protein
MLRATAEDARHWTSVSTVGAAWGRVASTGQSKEIVASQPSLVSIASNDQPSSPNVTAMPPVSEGWNPEAAKFAGRMNAAQTSADEERDLLEKRKMLLQAQMQRPLTRPEKARLAYVRWNLDRIEDARIGPHLDKLEAAIFRYENFMAEIASLKRELDSRVGTRRHPYP